MACSIDPFRQYFGHYKMFFSEVSQYTELVGACVQCGTQGDEHHTSISDQWKVYFRIFLAYQNSSVPEVLEW